MGFNDTMSTYLVASESQVLSTHKFRIDKSRNQMMSDALDKLLNPFHGNMHEVMLQASLK